MKIHFLIIQLRNLFRFSHLLPKWKNTLRLALKISLLYVTYFINNRPTAQNYTTGNIEKFCQAYNFWIQKLEKIRVLIQFYIIQENDERRSEFDRIFYVRCFIIEVDWKIAIWGSTWDIELWFTGLFHKF